MIIPNVVLQFIAIKQNVPHGLGFVTYNRENSCMPSIGRPMLGMSSLFHVMLFILVSILLDKYLK